MNLVVAVVVVVFRLEQKHFVNKRSHGGDYKTIGSFVTIISDEDQTVTWYPHSTWYPTGRYCSPAGL